MQTFDLRVEVSDGVAGEMTVAVTQSPAGEVDGVRVAVPPVTLAQAMHCTARRLLELAAEFTGAVLPPPLWAAWRASTAAAGSAGVCLRIRTAGAAAAALPWELLYDAERGAYLALDPLTPVVRYLEGPAGPPLPAPGGAPPVLLLGAAAPRDLPAPGAALEGVATALAPAVRAGRGRVERIDHLTLPRLEAALQERRPLLFHFHGHGFWAGYDGAGGLALEGRGGAAELLDSATLATLLGAARTQFVMLNACSSATAGSERWSGLAQGLVRRGVPAVVAHQGALDDDLGRVFAGRFYAALAASGDVAQAVTAGRIAMAARCAAGEQAGAWLAPLLFLRGDALLWPPADEFVDDARNRASPRSSVSSLPQSASDERGAINIENLNAGTVIMGDATIDMRGTTVNFPAAPPPTPDPRLDELVAGQGALLARQDAFQREVLAALAAAEQRVVAGVLDGMDERNRRLVEEVMLAVQGGQAPPAETQALLDAVAAVRAEVRGHGAALASLGDRLDALAAGEPVGPTEAEVKHRLVMTVPIVPFLLGYEGEIELKSRFGLDAAWQALVKKVRGERDEESS
ncbi:MAG: CHAT domain-containing protein [Caldilinea sp.]|nr:CHAT domain-containing protein [Caldilinea sp.]